MQSDRQNIANAIAEAERNIEEKQRMATKQSE
jgi:hypothetical protein